MRSRLKKIKTICTILPFSKVHKWFLLVGLLFVMFSCSGFIGFDADELPATRADLAVILNNILIKSGVARTLKPAGSFVDMSETDFFSMRFTLASEIMTGFTDGTFKPDKPLRNLETRNYLIKLAQLLSDEADARVRLQLNRILSWQDLSSSLLSGFHGNLVPYELVNPQGITPRSFVDRLPVILGLSSEIRLEGLVVDAVTRLPVDSAHMVIAEYLLTTDIEGRFELEADSAKIETEELFVAAEGYRPLKLKRDWRINPHVELRLNPVRSNLIIKAIADKAAVEDFEVIINNGQPVRGEHGEVSISQLRPGFHRIKVRSPGYEEYEGNLRTQDGTREMLVTLTRQTG